MRRFHCRNLPTLAGLLALGAAFASCRTTATNEERFNSAKLSTSAPEMYLANPAALLRGGEIIALEFTAPLWVLLLAPLLLGERLTARALVAGGLGFAGVLIVARPDAAGLSPGILAAASCALCFALTAVATKRLTAT